MFGNLFGGTLYKYKAGDWVYLPGDTQIWEVKWRGYLLLGAPGQRKRYSVYWLGEHHWDCYFEDEIIPVNQLPY